MYRVGIDCLVWFLGSIFFATSAFAIPSTKRSICPAFVANKKEGIVYPGDKFLCFKSSRDAVKLGLKRLSSLDPDALTGWWRLNVDFKTNTCSDVLTQSGRATIFVQIKETGDGIFADTCPGGDHYVGQRLLNNTGFTLTATKTLLHDSQCFGEESKVSYLIKMQGLSGATASQVSYSLVRTCLGTTTGSVQCHTEWQGDGGHEKPSHQFWPAVPDDLTQFAGSCATAMTKCSECHNGL